MRASLPLAHAKAVGPTQTLCEEKKQIIPELQWCPRNSKSFFSKPATVQAKLQPFLIPQCNKFSFAKICIIWRNQLMKTACILNLARTTTQDFGQQQTQRHISSPSHSTTLLLSPPCDFCRTSKVIGSPWSLVFQVSFLSAQTEGNEQKSRILSATHI